MPTGVYPRTAEHKAKLSKKMKEVRNRPEIKKRTAEITKEVMSRPEVKERMKKGIKRSWENPEIREKRSLGIAKAYESTEIRQKLSDARKKTWSQPGYRERVSLKIKAVYENSEVRSRISQAVSMACLRPEEKQRKSQAMKKVWSTMSKSEKERRNKIFWMAGVKAYQIAHPSSLENLVCNVLDKEGVIYRRQETLGDYIVDVYIPERNIVIEVDGEYWHSLPGRAERDKERDQWLSQQGFKVIRIREQELKINPQVAVTKKVGEVMESWH